METLDVPRNPRPENNYGHARETLNEYLTYFSKHLQAPYSYELPDNLLKTGDKNYYYYMCRGNAIQAVSGFMHMVLEDGDTLSLTKEQRIKIKEMEDSLCNLASGSMRTPEDMILIKNSVKTMVSILTEQERKI